jgi:hypothetical protein
MYNVILSWKSAHPFLLAHKKTQEEARTVLNWTMRDLQARRGYYVDSTGDQDVYSISRRDEDVLTHIGKLSMVVTLD